ncbi:rhodanese-like domain-containing protein [Sulfuricurvum sp.]|uniref:rhodanese-like domain-containing protein n=1 Tax=Sulfuricurvum sp. TaxID=2025608 RepID=UPI002636869B|nr:rhodanese-like domain-containing protein [Sulfuricurvum sp.]MDD2837969.1 rhodanese-like domain-containing protein [Sulfuricurvum sp.]MDD3597641.1 rhodanese-like domain-containing protein [Sulfuricurvum sp.]
MNEQIKHYENKLAYEIDSWDLSAGLNGGDKIVVIDARSAEAYSSEHIPEAINISHRMMDETTTDFIDKTALIVVYCDGIGCNASTKGALNMAKLGFKTKELIGGLDWWKRDGYPTVGEKIRQNEMISCGCD